MVNDKFPKKKCAKTFVCFTILTYSTTFDGFIEGSSDHLLYGLCTEVQRKYCPEYTSRTGSLESLIPIQRSISSTSVC